MTQLLLALTMCNKSNNYIIYLLTYYIICLLSQWLNTSHWPRLGSCFSWNWKQDKTAEKRLIKLKLQMDW